MTGREEPSTRELQENLQRRVLQVEGPEMLEKRYNRHGVPKKTASKSNAATAKTGSSLAETNFRGQQQHGNGNGRHAQNGAGAQTQTSGAQSQGAASTAASAAVAPDPVAQADTPTTNDSLGLDIECVLSHRQCRQASDNSTGLRMLATSPPFKWAPHPGTSSCLWTLVRPIFG